MLKALNLWALPDRSGRSVEDVFCEVAAHGFAGAEPVIGEDALITLESTEADCAAVREAAEQAGLELVSLASGLGWSYPLTADEAQVRSRGVEVMAHSLRVASWLGVPSLLVVPGMLAPPGNESHEHVPYDIAMERMREGLHRLVPVAEQVGVNIGLENVWNKVLLSPLEMRDFIDEFGSGFVRAYLDVGNVIAFGYAEDWVRVLGSRICCVHFKDYKRSVGTLEGFCPLLEGDVNYPAVMASLRRINYEGPCTAEFFGISEPELCELSESMDRILAM